MRQLSEPFIFSYIFCYYYDMKIITCVLLTFCNRQNFLIKILIFLPSVRIRKVALIKHPITDEVLGQMFKINMPNIIFFIFARLNDLLIDRCGRLRRDKLIACGVVQKD